MTISATSRKRDKLAAQLTWLANRQILNLPEDRRHGRFVPTQPDGAADPAERHQRRLPRHRPVGLRRRGVDQPVLRPAVGAAVTIGKTPGRVVRHIEDGFAIEFTRLQHPDSDRRQRHRRIASPTGKRRAPRTRHRAARPMPLRPPSPVSRGRMRPIPVLVNCAREKRAHAPRRRARNLLIDKILRKLIICKILNQI